MSSRNSFEARMTLPPLKTETSWVAVIGLLVGLFGVSTAIGGFIYSRGQFDQGVAEMREDLARYIGEHADLHKNRQAEITSNSARLDERIKAVEVEARSLDNIRYRLTVQEQGAASLTRAVDELRQALAAQSSDIRLIREIVTRLDPGPQQRGKP